MSDFLFIPHWSTSDSFVGIRAMSDRAWGFFADMGIYCDGPLYLPVQIVDAFTDYIIMYLGYSIETGSDYGRTS